MPQTNASRVQVQQHAHHAARRAVVLCACKLVEFNNDIDVSDNPFTEASGVGPPT